MSDMVCVNCGEKMLAKSKKRKYCSDKCKNQYNRQKNKVHKKNCLTCEKEFYASYIEAKYCSHECRGKALKEQYGYTLSDFEKVLRLHNRQMSVDEIINTVGCSTGSFYKVLKENNLDIQKLHESLNIEYKYDDNFYFTSKSAEKVFSILDDYFGVKGIREATFLELVNPKTSRLLRIDWYSEELNIAVEYNGKQHYKEQAFFNNPLEIIKEKDRLKREFCEHKGIRLVVFDYNEKLTNEYIINKILYS